MAPAKLADVLEAARSLSRDDRQRLILELDALVGPEDRGANPAQSPSLRSGLSPVLRTRASPTFRRTSTPTLPPRSTLKTKATCKPGKGGYPLGRGRSTRSSSARLR